MSRTADEEIGTSTKGEEKAVSTSQISVTPAATAGINVVGLGAVAGISSVCILQQESRARRRDTPLTERLSYLPFTE